MQNNAVVIDIHYRPFANRHRDRAYHRENDSRARADSDADPEKRPDLYRGFDREWIYSEGGPVRGPSGECKLRPAFRDGRTVTLFGNWRGSLSELARIGHQVGLGGGCHWWTEAVSQMLRGVERVEQGFIRSTAPYDAWSEAVIVHFDPEMIELETLIEVHLHTHASTSDHLMRGKYRSSVYPFDPQQADEAQAVLKALQADFDKPLVTNVLDFLEFKPSAERFHDYYQTDPERSFCTAYIDPKLLVLRERFSARLEKQAV